MSNVSDFANNDIIAVPTIPIDYPAADRALPLTRKENLMLALEHKKPAYMPNLGDAVQYIPPFAYGDMPANVTADGKDWFGVTYKYTAEQGSSAPLGDVLSEVTKWREEVVWPDYDAWDWRAGADEFARMKDPGRATVAWFTNGIFERLHILEGMTQGLLDLAQSPDDCREFFERVADHKTEMFNRLHEIYDLDFIIYNDDWGTQNGPFFSHKIITRLLLEPTKRFVKAVQDTGVKVVFHNCGRVDTLIHFLVEDIGADGLEIQSINDIKAILTQYGDRVTSEYQMDLRVLYDPKATEELARSYARAIVDEYGAQANPGAGVMLRGSALRPEIWYAFEKEMYEYSLAHYK
ncbi:MAG: hypothetical protein LBC58_02030 [Clostridiales Family XIII bacterium]|jgi:hypothetical protein|nr:hypothetical protein [Clostridiales Family XIII bacterium]